MPPQSFIELHGSIMEHEMFSMQTSEDAAGVELSNAHSSLLGTLSCIRRAYDIEEATATSRETNRR